MDAPLKVDALLFDVFGTVVDWRSTIVSEGSDLARTHGVEIEVDVDWAAFADRWRREGYLDPIRRMTAGDQPWAPIDDTLRDHLGRLAYELGFASVGPEVLDRFNEVWSRLEPWPDAPGGLDRLRGRYIISPLSNGTFASLTRMARHTGLRWDCVLAAELFGAYKPDPRTYTGATRLLGLQPHRVMLVAAHPSDLRAAQACGLQTGYVPRPLEWGPEAPLAAPADDGAEFDLVADDFLDLADLLGA